MNKVEISVEDKSTKKYDTFNELPEGKGYCNWEGTQTLFTHIFSISNSTATEFEFRFKIVADQDFLEQSSPDPNMGPQTYVTQSRDQSSKYFAQAQKSYMLL